MGNDEGLVDLNNSSGLKSALSGPAGEVVGVYTDELGQKKDILLLGLSSSIIAYLKWLRSLGWTWVGPRPTCHDLTADTR